MRMIHSVLEIVSELRKTVGGIDSSVVKGKVVDFCDKVMKLGTLVLYNLLNDFRCGAHFPESMP